MEVGSYEDHPELGGEAEKPRLHTRRQHTTTSMGGVTSRAPLAPPRWARRAHRASEVLWNHRNHFVLTPLPTPLALQLIPVRRQAIAHPPVGKVLRDRPMRCTGIDTVALGEASVLLLLLLLLK